MICVIVLMVLEKFYFETNVVAQFRLKICITMAILVYTYVEHANKRFPEITGESRKNVSASSIIFFHHIFGVFV